MMDSLPYTAFGALQFFSSVALSAERRASRSSERQGRMIDHDGSGSMEAKKQEGYF